VSRVYKICSASQWIACEKSGALPPSPVDVRDGYIHMSTAAQVRDTARLHFARQDDLWLLAIDTAVLGDALRWEPSRGGDLFPHLYGVLERSAIVHADPLPREGDERVWPVWLHPAAGGSDSARTPDAPAKP
jgi:uncharacterized protein (DUF952 family)